MIKAIIFDCFGVFYVNVSQQLASIAAKRSPQAGVEFEKLIALDDTGNIGEDGFNKRAAELTGLPLLEVKRRYAKLSLQRDNVMLGLVLELKAHYKTGLLTNLRPGMVNTLLTQKEMTKYFDDIVVSSDVGLVKPEPGIYQLICQRLGVRPDEAVFIDDTDINCRGAEQVGMRAIRFVSYGELKKELQVVLSDA